MEPNQCSIRSETKLDMPGPLESVPDDVLIEIFIAFSAVGLKGIPRHKRRMRQCPIIIASVCKRWRAVTLTAPRLWTRITINVLSSWSFVAAGHLVRLFNARSGTCPLEVSISLNTDMYIDF